MMLCDCYAIEPGYEDGDLEGLHFIWPYVPVKYSNKFRHIGWGYITWVNYMYVWMIVNIFP